ncbi:Flp family type IVb pilin [Syntrophomonas palmitatica]|uniref:Flp family type IVb pilin n=1 Tax=Syntrophomonas palmitatica TaxID=402877 RepID=UPI0006D21221|nr:Flp family type IVb pilin [Syntrophomonas palmitatica]
MFKMGKKLITNEEGQGMAEYGLILAGIAVVVMVAIAALGDRLVALFDSIVF